jgi:hypothetical protein
VAILSDRNVVKKEVEKKLKYMSLCIEIQRMWNQNSKIVPVMIRTSGIATKGLRKNLENITGKTFNRFTTEDSYTWNITLRMESTAD